MAQHFLLSAAARTLSLKSIYSEGEDAAYRRFCRLRWPETKGAPVCPVCGCLDIYDLTNRRRFKCAACHRQFSVTSGTIFASRKLSFVDLLGAICLFVNASKGLSAVQFSRDLDVQHKTAFVLMHKLREAMTAETREARLDGEVEVDGDTSDRPTCVSVGSTGGDWPIAAARAAWWSSCVSAAAGH
jgi:transposase-like protein